MPFQYKFNQFTQKDNADSRVQFITPAGPRQSLLLAKDPDQFCENLIYPKCTCCYIKQWRSQPEEVNLAQRYALKKLFHQLYHMCMRVCSVTQLCLTFCNPMDCSPPDFSVHGILQARILEWVDMPSSRESSWLRELNPRLLHHGQILYPLSHVGSPNWVYINI